MKIALAFFGLPRHAGTCFPSIEQHLLAPLATAGDLHVFHHLWMQRWVMNGRSRENGAQGEDRYAPFLRFRGLVRPRPVDDLPVLARLKPWGDAWCDGYQSLTHLVLQLVSLKAVTEIVAGTLEPDLVVFARPDLLYHGPPTQAAIDFASGHPDHVLLPCWESWGGCNDRFALCGARAWRAYGGRLLLAEHFCETTRRPLHAETFLRYAGVSAPVQAGEKRSTASVMIASVPSAMSRSAAHSSLTV